MFAANSESTVTDRSMPTLRCFPVRNFGRSLVPSRFQSSGGTEPAIVKVVFEPPGAGFGSGSGFGSGLGSGCGSGEGPGCSVFGTIGPALSAAARALVSRKTSLSKETSEASSGSPYHRRWNPPSSVRPDANPKSACDTNATIWLRRTASGSISLVSAPVRKLWRRLVSGHAPVSLNAGGQFTVEVACPHRFVEQSLGLQHADDAAAQRLACAGMASP